jgi:hypothetical protein
LWSSLKGAKNKVNHLAEYYRFQSLLTLIGGNGTLSLVMPPLHSVAASCCAHLLPGYPVRITSGSRPRVPAVVVSQSTQALMCDVFGQPDLFRGLPTIDRRIVAWGPGAKAVELPHAAVLISEADLVARLAGEWQGEPANASWTVHSSRPLPDGIGERHFGSRLAFTVPVDFDGSACWVESLDNGWLFLIPGWLIAVGGTPQALLAESRVVAQQARGPIGEVAQFPAYPRIADPLCGPGWLACGSAAMAFDPICGDGTGNAVREAILASAVIRAAARGEPADRLLAHYRLRLIAGFQRHLDLALQFYRRGNDSGWWRQEAAALQQGLVWCADQLPASPPFHYRLEGLDLKPTER